MRLDRWLVLPFTAGPGWSDGSPQRARALGLERVTRPGASAGPRSSAPGSVRALWRHCGAGHLEEAAFLKIWGPKAGGRKSRAILLCSTQGVDTA